MIYQCIRSCVILSEHSNIFRWWPKPPPSPEMTTPQTKIHRYLSYTHRCIQRRPFQHRACLCRTSHLYTQLISNCIMPNQHVDNNLIDLCGTNNDVKFALIKFVKKLSDSYATQTSIFKIHKNKTHTDGIHRSDLLCLSRPC